MFGAQFGGLFQLIIFVYHNFLRFSGTEKSKKCAVHFPRDLLLCCCDNFWPISQLLPHYWTLERNCRQTKRNEPTNFHEGALQYLVQSISLGWVGDEDAPNQVDGFHGDLIIFGNQIVAFLYFLIGALRSLSFERRDTKEESVDDSSQSPHINFEVVPLTVQHLGGNIVGSTADSPLELFSKF